MFPGSRIEEFKRIAPIIFRAVNYLQRDFGAEVTLVKSNNITDDILKEAMQNLSLKLKYTVESLNYITILNSEIVITKFGTTAMECTLIGTPFCSVYRAGLINYLIGKLLVKLDFFTITNILAKKRVVKELIQDDFTVENVYEECRKLLFNDKYRDFMKKDFKDIKRSLINYEINITAQEIICSYL